MGWTEAEYDAFLRRRGATQECPIFAQGGTIGAKRWGGQGRDTPESNLEAMRGLFEGIIPAVTLRLPFPPSGNILYPTGTDHRRHLSAAGRAYREAVRLRVWEWWCTTGEQGTRKVWPLTGRLAMQVDLTPPDARRRDIHDNMGKALGDALTHAGVYHDDSQIDVYLIQRTRPAHPAGITVQLWGLAEVKR